MHRDPGREAQGSLDQPNERTSALYGRPYMSRPASNARVITQTMAGPRVEIDTCRMGMGFFFVHVLVYITRETTWNRQLLLTDNNHPESARSRFAHGRAARRLRGLVPREWALSWGMSTDGLNPDAVLHSIARREPRYAQKQVVFSVAFMVLTITTERQLAELIAALLPAAAAVHARQLVTLPSKFFMTCTNFALFGPYYEGPLPADGLAWLLVIFCFGPFIRASLAWEEYSKDRTPQKLAQLMNPCATGLACVVLTWLNQYGNYGVWRAFRYFMCTGMVATLAIDLSLRIETGADKDARFPPLQGSFEGSVVASVALGLYSLWLSPANRDWLSRRLNMHRRLSHSTDAAAFGIAGESESTPLFHAHDFELERRPPPQERSLPPPPPPLSAGRGEQATAPHQPPADGSHAAQAAQSAPTRRQTAGARATPELGVCCPPGAAAAALVGDFSTGPSTADAASVGARQPGQGNPSLRECAHLIG